MLLYGSNKFFVISYEVFIGFAILKERELRLHVEFPNFGLSLDVKQEVVRGHISPFSDIQASIKAKGKNVLGNDFFRCRIIITPIILPGRVIITSWKNSR